MEKDEIRKMVVDIVKEQMNIAQFSVARVPVHTHNNIDSPTILSSNVGGFQIVQGIEQGMAAPYWLNGQAVNNPAVSDANTDKIDFPKVVVYPIPVIYGYGTTSTEEVTSGLSFGDTSATLTGAWGGSTVTTAVQFDSYEVRLVTFTNGSTAISWQGGLKSAAGTTITLINNARFHGGEAPFGTLVFFRNDDDGLFQLWVRSIPGILLVEWVGVDLGSGNFVYN